MKASIVVATYNRPVPLERLLESLSRQTCPRKDFEVVVVDDGSQEPAEPLTVRFREAIELVVLRQRNAGVAVARQHGVERARGRLLIFLDDDMLVADDFVAQHLAAHGERTRRVVMGQLLADPNIASMPLFERFYAYQLDRFARSSIARGTFQGFEVYTGNLSLPRDLFFEVGGFDPAFFIEDVELGVRLGAAGAEFIFSTAVASVHASDHTSCEKWLARSLVDGRSWIKLARKHPDVPAANPWRHLWLAHPIARPLFAAAVAAPNLAPRLSRFVLRGATEADRRGLEQWAIKATTVAYGVQYFAGVRAENGSLWEAVQDLRAYRSLRIRRRGADAQFAISSARDGHSLAPREYSPALYEYFRVLGEHAASRSGQGRDARE